MWQVTCDRWQVTGDNMTHGVRWTFSQNFSFSSLTAIELWFFEDLEEKDQWMNQSIYDGGVCITALATPGQLFT